MDDEVGGDDLLQSRPEGGDELGREIRDEADRVGQDRLVEAGQGDFPHRRVEGGEEQILRHHVGLGKTIEQGGLARIGIADQCDDRPWRALASGAVEGPGAGDLLELLLELRHAVADQPPVGLDLGLAGAAEEAEAAALPFEVGPAPDQPARLIVEMSELDLKPAFRRRRPLAENLENEAGPVDDLGLGRGLEILLLDGRDRSVDDDQLRFVARHRLGDRFNLSGAEKGRGLGGADLEMKPVRDLDPDRLGETGGLVESSLDVAPPPPRLHLGKSDDRLGAAAELAVGNVFGGSQASGSSSSSSMKLTGRSGCTVEMACL